MNNSIFAQKCLLIADDEPLVLSVTKSILERQGCRVIDVVDGTQAVAQFEENRSSIDLVVLDVSMPGLSGIDVLTAIRKRSPQVPIVLTSGFQDDFGQATSIQGFVLKPFRPRELLRVLSEALTSSIPGELPK